MNDQNIAELIIEQANDAIIYADLNGNIQRWNATASRLFGFTTEEALGQSLDIIIPERARKAHWDGFNLAIKNKILRLSGKHALTKALHKDQDKKIYIEMSFALIQDDEGEIIGSVAIAREVIKD